MDMQTKNIARFSINIHSSLRDLLLFQLKKIGVENVLVGNSRCVRQKINSGILSNLGFKSKLADAPTELLRFSLDRDAASGLLSYLVEQLKLDNPARASCYIQNVSEYKDLALPNVKFDCDGSKQASITENLVLITTILSLKKSAETLIDRALKLGAGVPFVALGKSAGVRERMGLIRITIPDEKEIVKLLVPAHDAKILADLLIEEANLDKPGGGFLYLTPVNAGVVDSLISIGKQEHAASIEQIIAAIDEINQSTAWRKRFVLNESFTESAGNVGLGGEFKEIVFVCQEGAADILSEAAISAGADGATVSAVRYLSLNDNQSQVATLVERGILCIKANRQNDIISAINCASNAAKVKLHSLQTADIKASFVYRPNK